MNFQRLKISIITQLYRLHSEKRARLIALDLMRGLFLIIIFADHISYSPSLFFQIATHHSAALASAAEGFFVISGMLIGYIYGPKIVKKPLEVAKKLWKRASVLYLLTVVFTLLYTAWAYLLPEGYPRADPYPGGYIEIIYKTITLQYQFGWADFLSRYAVFVAISPLALWLITKRFAWLVAIASFIVWRLYAYVPILQFYTAWQLLFIFGIIIGYYLPVIEASVKKLPKLVKALGWWSIVGLAGVSYIATVSWIVVVAPYLSIPGVPPEMLTHFEKNPLAKGRIAIGTLWFTALYLVFRRYEYQINKLTRGTLLIFGQNSLFVYTLSAFVIFSMDVFMLAPENSPLLLNTLVGIVGISIIYTITKHRAAIKAWVVDKGTSLLHYSNNETPRI